MLDTQGCRPVMGGLVLTASALTDGAKGLHDLQSKVQSSNGADEAT